MCAALALGGQARPVNRCACGDAVEELANGKAA